MDVATTRRLTGETVLLLGAGAGLTALGAVDSQPLPGDDVAVRPPSENPGQGEATGPRTFDYGPGTAFGGFVSLIRRGRQVATLRYDARHLWIIDGVRANHLLQEGSLDVSVPLRGRLGAAVSFEYFDRRSHYQRLASRR